MQVHFVYHIVAFKKFVLPMIEGKPGKSLVLLQSTQPFNHPSVLLLPPFVRIKYSNWTELIFLPYSIFYLLLFFFKYRPTSIVSHMSLNSPVILFASFLARIPDRVYFNHGFPHLGHTGFSSSLLKVLEFFNFLFSTRAICVSPSQASTLNKSLLHRLTPLTSTYPGSCAGIAVSDISSIEQHSKKLQHFTDSRVPLTLTYIGRATSRKGFPFVLDVLTHYLRFYSDSEGAYPISLQLVGVNDESVHAYKHYESIKPYLRTIPYTDLIIPVLDSSCILILPSLHEGFGYAYLEAAARSNAIIAYDIQGPDSLLQHGFNSLLLPLDTPASRFASAIHSLSQDRQLLVSLMDGALDSSRRFSRELVLNSFIL